MKYNIFRKNNQIFLTFNINAHPIRERRRLRETTKALLAVSKILSLDYNPKSCHHLKEIGEIANFKNDRATQDMVFDEMRNRGWTIIT